MEKAEFKSLWGTFTDDEKERFREIKGNGAKSSVAARQVLMMRESGDPRAKDEPSFGERAAVAATSAADVLSGGLSPNFVGAGQAVRAAFDPKETMGEGYRRGRKQQLENLQAARDYDPNASMVGTGAGIVGGILMPGSVVATGGKALPTIAKMAGISAAGSAAAADVTDPGDILGEGGKGFIAGGLLGAGGAALGKVLRKAPAGVKPNPAGPGARESMAAGIEKVGEKGIIASGREALLKRAAGAIRGAPPDTPPAPASSGLPDWMTSVADDAAGPGPITTELDALKRAMAQADMPQGTQAVGPEDILGILDDVPVQPAEARVRRTFRRPEELAKTRPEGMQALTEKTAGMRAPAPGKTSVMEAPDLDALKKAMAEADAPGMPEFMGPRVSPDAPTVTRRAPEAPMPGGAQVRADIPMSEVLRPRARFNLEREIERVGSLPPAQRQPALDALARAHGTAPWQAGGVAKKLGLSLPGEAPFKAEARYMGIDPQGNLAPGTKPLPSSAEGALTMKQEAAGVDLKVPDDLAAAIRRRGPGITDKVSPAALDFHRQDFKAAMELQDPNAIMMALKKASMFGVPRADAARIAREAGWSDDWMRWGGLIDPAPMPASMAPPMPSAPAPGADLPITRMMELGNSPEQIAKATGLPIDVIRKRGGSSSAIRKKDK